MLQVKEPVSQEPGREGALPAGAERRGQGHLRDTRPAGPGGWAAAVSPAVGPPGSESSRGALLPAGRHSRVESQSREREQSVQRQSPAPSPATLATLAEGRGSGPEPSCQGRGASNLRRGARARRSDGSLSLCPQHRQSGGSAWAGVGRKRTRRVTERGGQRGGGRRQRQRGWRSLGLQKARDGGGGGR